MMVLSPFIFHRKVDLPWPPRLRKGLLSVIWMPMERLFGLKPINLLSQKLLSTVANFGMSSKPPSTKSSSMAWMPIPNMIIPSTIRTMRKPIILLRPLIREHANPLYLPMSVIPVREKAVAKGIWGAPTSTPCAKSWL